MGPLCGAAQDAVGTLFSELGVPFNPAKQQVGAPASDFLGVVSQVGGALREAALQHIEQVAPDLARRANSRCQVHP